MTDDDQEESSSFIKTATSNYVSRQAIIDGPQNVELRGKSVIKSGIHIRGDLGKVQIIGRYVLIGEHTILQPSDNTIPLRIRGHVVIGDSCVIQAASIGSYVRIGRNVKIGKRCLIKDACIIEDNTILGDDTVVAPFSRVSGRPGQITEELPPSAAVELQEAAMDAYQDFVKSQK